MENTAVLNASESKDERLPCPKIAVPLYLISILAIAAGILLLFSATQDTGATAAQDVQFGLTALATGFPLLALTFIGHKLHQLVLLTRQR